MIIIFVLCGYVACAGVTAAVMLEMGDEHTLFERPEVLLCIVWPAVALFGVPFMVVRASLRKRLPVARVLPPRPSDLSD